MNAKQPIATGSDPSNSMPSTNAPVTNDAEDIWDEERIEKALKTLKEMHIQVSSDRKSLYLLHLINSLYR